MARFLSSILLFLLILPSLVQLINLSCTNWRKKQFLDLIQPSLTSSLLFRREGHFPSRSILVPSSPDLDEINSTEGCLPLDLSTFTPNSDGRINITDDQNITTSQSNLSTSTNAPDAEPPIVPFEEWTKQKLEQEKIKLHSGSMTNGNQNVDHLAPTLNDKAVLPTVEKITVEEKVQTTKVIHSIPLVISKRNYASKECGAKVIGANDDSENRGAILNDKEKDDYMRNPCAKDEKFLIIELCETIQPQSIELANLELFSSSPKNFRLLASERFPTVEWTNLGDFEAQDSREVQSFQIPQHNTYIKFLRLELLSHYGKEHYCTLSVFRVYGMSMVDEYEAEANHAASFTVVEHNQGLPIKAPETQPNESIPPPEKPLIAPIPQPVESYPEPSVGISSKLNIVEPLKKLFPPAAPWQIYDCNQCDGDERPQAVTTWLCYVFSPSICTQRNFKLPKNITSVLSRGQISFLKFILKKAYVCPLNGHLAEPKSYVPAQPDIPEAIPLKQKSVLVQSTETEVKKQTIIQHSVPSNVPLPAGTLPAKESIFLKLNKRLTSLELNISLSSQYLTELSRQYVAQTEENRKNQEKLSKFIEESVAMASRTLSKQFGDQLHELKSEVNNLSQRFKAFSQTPTSNIIHGKFEKTPDGSLVVRYPTADHCSSGEYENIYLDESDGLWTTKQLVVVIAVMQAATFAMIFVLQYLWKSNNQAPQKIVLVSADVDVRKLIASEVQNELNRRQSSDNSGLTNTCSSSSDHAAVPIHLPAVTNTSPSKKRRKKKRNTNSVNAFAAPESDKWDSTSVSSNLSAPSTSVCSTGTSVASPKKKTSTASRDSCFTNDSSVENHPPDTHFCNLQKRDSISNSNPL